VDGNAKTNGKIPAWFPDRSYRSAAITTNGNAKHGPGFVNIFISGFVEIFTRQKGSSSQ